VDEDTSNRAIHFISQKRKLKTNLTNKKQKSYSIESLGAKQRIAYDVILDHYRLGFDPLCMIIQGTAGTGKSYLIGVLKNTLDSVSLLGKSPLLLLAPTGVAAFNIPATTVHSTLHILIKEITHSQGPQLITLQEEMKYVVYFDR